MDLASIPSYLIASDTGSVGTVYIRTRPAGRGIADTGQFIDSTRHY